MKWEYRCWIVPADKAERSIELTLNELGLAGWELVAAVRHIQHVEYLFKRELK